MFTSDREQFGWSQRIAREGRAEFLAVQTKVDWSRCDRLLAAVEELAAEWQPWDDLLDQARSLMAAGPPELASRTDQVRYLLWGQAGLLRRPPDARLAQAHRRAPSVCSDGAAGAGRVASSTRR